MGLTYFKRFRMEIDLTRLDAQEPALPPGYHFRSWQPELLPAHAEAKYHSFRAEIDANVFPCLGDSDGCLRLMREISHKDGFLAEATWLAVYQPQPPVELELNDSWGRQFARREAQGGAGSVPEYCGTIQGIRDRSGFGAIQNLGIVPEHRGRGVGAGLMLKALQGFREVGLRRAFLEVTAQNEGAIKLYRRMGFCKARTVYKAVEITPFAVR